VVLPKDKEAVLLGSAVLGAVASGLYKDLLEAMQVFNRAEKILLPSTGHVAEYHKDKYIVFHKMYEDQIAYKNVMMKWK
jgi:ribulose kinase